MILIYIYLVAIILNLILLIFYIKSKIYIFSTNIVHNNIGGDKDMKLYILKHILIKILIIVAILPVYNVYMVFIYLWIFISKQKSLDYIMKKIIDRIIKNKKL